MTGLALDTSVAIPLVVRTHVDHAAVTRWWDGRPVSLCGDALVALAAVAHDAPLATRDLRARSTYERVGARVVLAD